MGFLFPLFLLAGLALVIPVLIHLFNLRRYKRVAFPDTRFLRNIQLSTKRQAKIHNWRLLLMRLLFLAALVLAFAQPFLGKGESGGKAAVSVIYIDNSYSMTISEGQESLLQQAKKKARQLIASSDNTARFLLLSNDKMAATRPMLRSEALQALNDIHPVARVASLRQVMNSIIAAQSNEGKEPWNIYLFSDLQQSTLDAGDKLPLPANATLYCYPLEASKVANLYIDTAYFLSPNLDTRQSNPLVVRVKQSGASVEKGSNLSVTVGGQVRAVSAIAMKEDEDWVDTLPLQLNGAGWQEISLSLQDHPLSFDDTFRIAARTSPELSVLIVGDGAVNPYLQAAFRTYQGIKIQQEPAGAVNKAQWPQYSLIILQNLSQITPGIQDAVKEALQRGQNILLFPGNVSGVDQFNQGLKAWGDISFGKEDTTRQQVVSLQQAHPLLQDVFEKVPDNIQLPVTAKRYPVTASVAANQQALMSFRDGKPFLAQYALMQGKLYLCASPLDDRSSNFALSYFFVPVLYKMAVQGSGGNMYARSVGSSAPLWLPVSGADDRKVWHLARPGFDAIPSQRPSGIGVELFLNNTARDAGFYRLYNEASKDTVLVGLNALRSESQLGGISHAALERTLAPARVRWLDEQSVGRQGWRQAQDPFPLWKICVIVALCCLAGESFLLLRKQKAGSPVAAA
ncbi:BatA domain-containing protein [Taibaiella koreensis]|uniref:BatA domain-containing protein n=1 Tax=Taibaiella koreensis TaxID=1268548 RepID=UPI0013C331C2|nr:BatA domain-containing protein [Taibaiella koreensis]